MHSYPSERASLLLKNIWLERLRMHFALELLREARWLLPSTSCGGGIGWALALLLCILAFVLGCCCGGAIALVALSARLRQAILWLVAGCASTALQADIVPATEVVRRRLAQYRGD